jgi:hypothetical protein
MCREHVDISLDPTYVVSEQDLGEGKGCEENLWPSLGSVLLVSESAASIYDI